jgi:hypothetical protein
VSELVSARAVTASVPVPTSVTVAAFATTASVAAAESDDTFCTTVATGTLRENRVR